jgi:nitric oxide reductase NorQ protein
VNEDVARRLVSLAEKTRNLKDRGLIEGASTRLLIHAGKLIAAGIEPKKACETAVAGPLTDDHEMLGSLGEIISALF